MRSEQHFRTILKGYEDWNRELEVENQQLKHELSQSGVKKEREQSEVRQLIDSSPTVPKTTPPHPSL